MSFWKAHTRAAFVGVGDGRIFTDFNFLRVFLPAYVTSFAWMFLIPANFWDDLAIRNNPDLIAMGDRASLPTMGRFLAGLLELPHPNFAARGFVFLLFICVVLLVRRFIADLALAPERERNAIAMLTALFPLFLSRFQIATSYYSLSLLLFCVGSLLLVKTLIGKRSFSYRVAAYACFILAFVTQSFLVLYGFVLLLILLHLSRRAPPGRNWERFSGTVADLARRAPDAFLLPFAFFITKAWLIPPTGLFAAYNAVTPQGVIRALRVLPVAAIEALADTTGLTPTGGALGLILLLSIAWTLLASPGKPVQPGQQSDTPPPPDGAALLTAFVGVMFAVFPYVAVSRAVVPYDFDDRNQVTMVLVIGAVVVYVLRLFFRPFWHWSLLFAVLIWAVATNVSTYIAIIVDGHIQNAVVQAFSQSRTVRENKSFLVDDSQWPFLSRGRRPSTAQLNCLMKAAFGDETRLAVELSYKPFDWEGNLKALNRFRDTGTCFRAYQDEPPVLLTVSPGPLPLTNRRIVKLTFDWMLRPERYPKDLDGLTSASVTSLPEGLLKPR